MTDRRLTIAACLLLALATVIAATSSGLEWRRDTVSVHETTPDGQPTGSGESSSEDVEAPDEPAADEGRNDFRLTLPGVFSLLLLLAVTALALAILARLNLVIRRRRRIDAGVRESPGSLRQDDGPDEEELAQALRAQVAAIEEGSPRNAIVAAWIALERVAEGAGVPRLPSDTSTDFALRTLSAHAVDRDALDTLAGLYREARFSGHDLTETHRSRARQCLERLRLQLGGAAR